MTSHCWAKNFHNSSEPLNTIPEPMFIQLNPTAQVAPGSSPRLQKLSLKFKTKLFASRKCNPRAYMLSPSSQISLRDILYSGRHRYLLNCSDVSVVYCHYLSDKVRHDGAGNIKSYWRKCENYGKEQVRHSVYSRGIPSVDVLCSGL